MTHHTSKKWLGPNVESSEQGGAVIEFALIFPLLMALLAGVIEFGFIMWEKHVLTAASREGAIIAATNPSISSAQISNLIKTRIREGGVNNTAVTVTGPTEQSIPGDSARKLKVVTASKPYDFKLIPDIFTGFAYILGGDPTSNLNIVGISKAVQEY